MDKKKGSVTLQIMSKLSTLSTTELQDFKKISKDVANKVITYISLHVVSFDILSNSHVFIDLLLTNDDITKKYNKKLRGIDKTTNVISVQFFTNDELFKQEYQNILHIGELIISVPKALEEAVFYKVSKEAHFARLVIHGILHLLGYDHHDDILASEMLNIERKILKILGYEVDSLVSNYFIKEE